MKLIKKDGNNYTIELSAEEMRTAFQKVSAAKSSRSVNHMCIKNLSNLLVSGLTRQEACTRLSIKERTFYRALAWLKYHGFFYALVPNTEGVLTYLFEGELPERLNTAARVTEKLYGLRNDN